VRRRLAALRAEWVALSAEWTRGELFSVAGAVALLILTFAFKWFGVAGVAGRTTSRPASQSAINAWDALSVLRWLMLATILVAVGSFVLHSTQRGHGVRTNTSPLITAFGGVTAALVCYRVLIDLPDPSKVLDQKLGAMLGVLSALAIAFGGFDALREERARARQAMARSRRPAGLAPDVRAR
jgi:formate hydrogenlyase subunit 3/multisubunit Na+/H+ antiporter MnhD subunit